MINKEEKNINIDWEDEIPLAKGDSANALRP